MSVRVMIVDDSLTVRMDLAEAFQETGFETVLCASGEEALRTIETHVPSLVILDVVLPDADGVELVGRLRERAGKREVPVILLSSAAEIHDRVRGLTGGASEYVGKPYEVSYLVDRARALLRPAGGPRDGSPLVLVIDDSLTYREELVEHLHAAGYQTATASTGEEGLRLAAGLHPSAIVVDGVMPGMDGTAVLRRIRLDPGLQSTPCLLLTASEGAASEITALDSGADGYVRKGAAMEVVLARVGALLRASANPREAAGASSLMAPKRILVVDHDARHMAGLAEHLRTDGYEVVTTQSGREALEFLAVETVDCILIDPSMPDLSGVETCRRIKSLPALRNVPLIISTERDDEASMIEGMNAGADDYVVKSLDFDVIRARLRAQLRRKQFEDENRRVREAILRKQAEADAAREQAELRQELLRQLESKNRDLENLNQELRTFAYSVSHDLRQPLRALDGFSRILLEEYGPQLDETGRHYLDRVRASAQRTSELMDGLLLLSRASNAELQKRRIRIDAIARTVTERLRVTDPDREAEIDIGSPIEALGDPELIESVLENLLGNAWKFTAGRRPSRIEVGTRMDGDELVYYVRDNGAGFDMAHAAKLFTPFQRLHTQQEFPGTGVGLATTQRIVRRHGGRLWAEAAPGAGATFYFSLGAADGPTEARST